MRGLLVILLLIPNLAAAQIDSGGGSRSGNGVRVRDSLGQPAAGFTSSATVRAATGVLFGISIPTPVDLLAFHMVAGPHGVELRWTASEDDGVAWFTVERAGTGDAFTAVGSVYQGPGPHHFVDPDPPAAITRYRLEARLRDGSVEYLGPWEISVDLQTAVPALVFHARPNPFRDRMTLSLALREASPVMWRLLDLQGRWVAEGDLGLQSPGTHAIAFRPPASLANGVYFLEVEAGSLRDVQKVMKLP